MKPLFEQLKELIEDVLVETYRGADLIPFVTTSHQKTCLLSYSHEVILWFIWLIFGYYRGSGGKKGSPFRDLYSSINQTPSIFSQNLMHSLINFPSPSLTISLATTHQEWLSPNIFLLPNSFGIMRTHQHKCIITNSKVSITYSRKITNVPIYISLVTSSLPFHKLHVWKTRLCSGIHIWAVATISPHILPPFHLVN